MVAGASLMLVAPWAIAQEAGEEANFEVEQEGPDVDVEVEGDVDTPAPPPPPRMDADVDVDTETDVEADFEPMPQRDTEMETRAYLTEPAPPAASYREPDRDLGMELMLGGGVQGFIESAAREFTDVGGAWNVRLGIGNEQVLGAEIGYLGAAQNVTALGLDQEAFLLTTGAEAAARLNVLTGPVQPYVLGGAGWTNFRVTGDDFNNSSIEDSENVVHIPVGVGIGGRIEEVRLDARGVVRAVPQGDLFAEEGNMHTWGANVSAGWDF
jgi:hypothetical protein